MSELAINNLREEQTQLDEDGVFVGVSRQALEETLYYIDSLRQEVERLRACLEWCQENTYHIGGEVTSTKAEAEVKKLCREQYNKCNEALAPHIEGK